MDPRSRNIPIPQEIALSQREFLEAQEVKAPASVDELREATDHAFGEVEIALGKTDSFETWTDTTDDLEDAFFDTADGALGKRLIELIGLTDPTFAARRDEAEALVRQTATAASRLYPIIHRLQTIGFAPTREEVVRKLSTGELVKQIKVQNVSITPIRETLVGLLHKLDKRVGTNLWSFEYAPELPSNVVVTDPFDATDRSVADHWRHQVLAKHEVAPDKTYTILTVSGDTTERLAWELENIHEQTDDAELKAATQTVLDFLSSKAVYYQAPDARDFELYHLGLENPEDLMSLFRALDQIKHKDPELFLELVGVNPEDGGRSPFFGSFLHKAIYNTQKAINHAKPELGELAIKTMMNQLLTLSEHVQTYAGVVSQESLKAMAGEIRKSVEAAAPEKKGMELLMAAIPFTTLAIDAEVRRQLEALRDTSIETIRADLDRHIGFTEYPLKLIDFLHTMPEVALQDPLVQKKLRAIFPNLEKAITLIRAAKIHDDQQHSVFVDQAVLKPLYDRIPLLDETRNDLGFGNRIGCMLRDAKLEHGGTWLPIYSEAIKGRESHYFDCALGNVQNVVMRKDIHWIITARPSVIEAMERLTNYLRGGPRTQETAYWLGQHAALSAHLPPETREWKEFADTVLLSLLSHPKGPETAFKYFDVFCDLISADRMVEIILNKSDRLPKFTNKFLVLPENFSREYARFLFDRLLRSTSGDEPFPEHIPPENNAEWKENLRKLNDVIVQGKTPWTFGSGENVIDLWDVWENGKYFGPLPAHKDDIRPDQLEVSDQARQEITTLLAQGFGIKTLENHRGECILTLWRAEGDVNRETPIHLPKKQPQNQP